MQLSKRLEAIGALVPKGCVLADIGTDHGYLPVALCMRGWIRGAIAMDVNRGPLERAQSNVEQNGLEAYIETRRSDGLKALRPGEADCAVIAGMGGRLMLRILEDSAAVSESLKAFVLQPQSEIANVRRYVSEHGMYIEAEAMVLEDGKFYPMMRVLHGHAEPMNELDYQYGPLLLRERSPVLFEFLKKERASLEGIRSRLEEAGGVKSQVRLGEVEQKLARLDEALALFVS